MVAGIFAAFSQGYISTEIYRSEKINHLFLLGVLTEGKKNQSCLKLVSSLFSFLFARDFFLSLHSHKLCSQTSSHDGNKKRASDLSEVRPLKLHLLQGSDAAYYRLHIFCSDMQVT